MVKVVFSKSERDVKVVHSCKSPWAASKLRLVKACKIKTSTIKILIKPNADQKPTTHSLSVANAVPLTTVPRNQDGKLTFNGGVDDIAVTNITF